MTVLEQLKAGPRVVGAKQTRRAIHDGRAIRVYLAQDADPGITEPIEAICNEQSLSIERVPSMKDLGVVCGIAVGAAVAVLVRQ